MHQFFSAISLLVLFAPPVGGKVTCKCSQILWRSGKDNRRTWLHCLDCRCALMLSFINCAETNLDGGVKWMLTGKHLKACYLPSPCIRIGEVLRCPRSQVPQPALWVLQVAIGLEARLAHALTNNPVSDFIGLLANRQIKHQHSF